MRLSQRARGLLPSPTLSLDARVKELLRAGRRVINFSVGEPDFDTPEFIKEAAREALAAGKTKYTPSGGIPELKEAIVEKLARDGQGRYSPDEVVVSVGAKHSLYNLFQVLVDPGDEVIIPIPYWVTYPEQVRLAGGVPVFVACGPETGFRLTADALREACTSRTRLLVLNSPQNPSGTVYTRAELEALAEVVLERDLTVISDEIYLHLLYDGAQHVSMASLAPELKERVVVVDGVSKTYAMTGWRIGFLAAPRPVAKAVADLQSQSTSNPTSIAQWAAVAALRGDQSSVEAMRQEFDRRRKAMVDGLRSIPGVEIIPPQGAFYCFPDFGAFVGREIRGHTVSSVDELAALLLDEVEVAVVPGSGFGAPAYARLSYATSLAEVQEGVARIRAWLTS